MAMKDHGADKEFIISTNLQQLGVKAEYEKLRSVVNDAKFSIMSLENRLLLDGHEDEAVMRKRLEKTQELFYEAEDKLDELSYEAMTTFHHMDREIMREASSRKVSMISSLLLVRGYPLLLYRRRLMSHKIKDLQPLLNNLKGEIGHGATTPTHQKEKEKDIDKALVLDDDYAPFVRDVGGDVIGRHVELREILEILSLAAQNDQQMNITVIPIVGRAGVGKTGLTRRILYRQGVLIRPYYDLKIWVTVSQKELSIKKVVEEIVKASIPTGSSISSSSVKGDLTDRNSIQHLFEENLSGRRFLLVLDDVLDQDKEKWDNLVRMLRIGLVGSAVIVTTRSVEVASMVRTTLAPYKLSELSADDSWELFEIEAFENGNSEDHLVRKLGSTIVKQCHGLPLVLKAVGRALRFKPKVEWWAAALQTHLREPADKSAGTVFPILKMCYDSMPSLLQKRCFAYCSVFPENFSIEKKSLIQQWMAQGFLEEEEEEEEKPATAASSSTSSSGAGDRHHVKRL